MSKNTLDEDIRCARKMGISYGAYMDYKRKLKEVDEMPKGYKADPDIVEKAQNLYLDGKSHAEICKELTIPHGTVGHWIEKWKAAGIEPDYYSTKVIRREIKKEPASVAADTSSKQNISTDIIPDNSENVKYTKITTGRTPKNATERVEADTVKTIQTTAESGTACAVERPAVPKVIIEMAKDRLERLKESLPMLLQNYLSAKDTYDEQVKAIKELEDYINGQR